MAAALLNIGNPLVSTNQAQTMAGNISRMALANNQGNTGRSFGNTNFFYAPGQMAEISGVADGGEATEAVIRGAIGLTTVRGSGSPTTIRSCTATDGTRSSIT